MEAELQLKTQELQGEVQVSQVASSLFHQMPTLTIIKVLTESTQIEVSRRAIQEVVATCVST